MASRKGGGEPRKLLEKLSNARLINGIISDSFILRTSDKYVKIASYVTLE